LSNDVQTVLLADPDVIVRTLLAQYLRECGYRVLEASSTREIRQFLADTSRSIEVVLAEMAIPDEGGFAFASWMRTEYPTVPVILAASVERAAEKASTLCEEGPIASKPYDHQLIVDRIRRMLATRARVQNKT